MAIRVYCLLVLVSHLANVSSGGGTFQFFLDILDRMDPSWVLEQYDAIGTRIHCSSLCYQNKGSCAYFGFLNHKCYLLKDNVDSDSCSQEDCEVSGMKIYKWKMEQTTTMPAETTTTTTLAPTTTTEEPTTTTTEATTTTTTDATTTTTKATTTTTEEPTSTTTTEATTTTTEPTTTTTEPTTTTTEPTTTTMEPTTTTTERTTTTTEMTTTTTDVTSTTTEGFTCEAPEGVATDLECPIEKQLINGLGSRGSFFNDATGAKCELNFKTIVYSEEEEIVKTFFSLDGGLTLDAYCPSDDHLIVKLNICIKNAHIPRLILYCRDIKDPDTIEKRYNVSSEDPAHNLVQCGKLTGVQKVFFEDADGKGLITKVTFTCVQIYQEEDEAPAVGAPAVK